MSEHFFNKNEQLINKFNHNKHAWMMLSCMISIAFLLLSVFIISYERGELISKLDGCVIQKIALAFIKFLNLANIKIAEMFIAIAPLIGTAIMALLNGKKLVIILQFVTIFHYKRIRFFSIVSSISLLLFVYAIAENRTTAATIALISFAIFHIYILCYLIRFYNDKAYYRDEVCTYILKYYSKDKKKELRNKRKAQKKPNKFLVYIEKFLKNHRDNIIIKKFIEPFRQFRKHKKKSKFEIYLSHYIFPDVPTDYNVIVNDIALIEYLLLNINFNNKETQKINNEGYQQFNCFDDFFDDLFIKLVANMRRTYSKSSDEFLFIFAEQISNIRLDNHNYDFLLHALVRVCLIEYLIEAGNWKNEFESEYIDKILLWLENNDYIFPKSYGCKESKSTTKNEQEMLKQLNDVYNTYIEALDKESVINFNSYCTYELDYMKNKKILLCDFTTENLCNLSFKYEKYEVVLSYRE